MVALARLAAFVVGGVLANAMIGTAYSTEFALPDVESRRGFDILDEHFARSTAGGEGGTIVFRADQGVTDPEVQAAMTELFDQASQIEGITLVSPYAPDGAQQVASQGPEARANLDPSSGAATTTRQAAVAEQSTAIAN
jgi:RND superfamily putative drug exporter